MRDTLSTACRCNAKH